VAGRAGKGRGGAGMSAIHLLIIIPTLAALVALWVGAGVDTQEG
jgi:hypothetical protein